MATTELKPPPSRQEPTIGSLLARLRRRIRAYVWADGIAATLVFVGVSFWASLAFDWLVESPPAFRMLILAGISLAFGYVVVRFLLSRLVVRLADRNMALLL